MSDAESGVAQPAGRLAAELGHFESVERVEKQFPDRLFLKVSDDGLSRTPMNTIRSFGWKVSGFTIHRNSVSVVQEDGSR